MNKLGQRVPDLIKKQRKAVFLTALLSSLFGFWGSVIHDAGGWPRHHGTKLSSLCHYLSYRCRPRFRRLPMFSYGGL